MATTAPPTETPEDNKIFGLERTPFIVITVLLVIALILLVIAVIAFGAKKKKGKYGITKSSISKSSTGFIVISLIAFLLLIITPIVLFAILPRVQKDETA